MADEDLSQLKIAKSDARFGRSRRSWTLLWLVIPLRAARMELVTALRAA